MKQPPARKDVIAERHDHPRAWADTDAPKEFRRRLGLGLEVPGGQKFWHPTTGCGCQVDQRGPSRVETAIFLTGKRGGEIDPSRER